MNKFVFTFGSSFLQEIKHFINPMEAMLVIEAKTENEARNEVMKSFIGEKFCTSYPYEKVAQEFKDKYSMVEYSLLQFENMKNK